MLIDTHCHLDDERYAEDLDEVLARAHKAGVDYFVVPGADPKSLERAKNLSEKYDSIYFAAGVHPYDAANYDEDTLEQFVAHPKCVAVGECGLDYYRLPQDESEKAHEKRVQKKVFEAQIGLAKRAKKPLIVHIRDASHDCKEILLAYDAEQVGGVLHCYNADEQLLSLASHGFYFGIGGVLTFSNAKKLVHVLPKIPLDKLVFETDAPYLTPHPFRGERNEPAKMLFVTKEAARLLDISEEKIAEISTENAKNLFKFAF